MEPSPAEVAEEAETVAMATLEASDDKPAAPPERKTDYKKVGVTDVSSCQTFWGQQLDNGKRSVLKGKGLLDWLKEWKYV